ncbi:hypothetical protein JXI42_01065 [bacterium]|nr:hypothetical protein [bacterium]
MFFSCSSDDDDDNGNGPGPTEGQIGPEGGIIEIAGGVALDIPAGALADTVEFSIDENTSPTPVGGDMEFVSTVYTMEPSGTNFLVPATVTLKYNEADLGGTAETSVKLYTNDGSGWEELPATVDTDENEVTSNITHLSDFAAAAEIGTPAEGVYASLELTRFVVQFPAGDSIIEWTMDNIYAWFDSAFAPCEPLHPLNAGTITCNEFTLNWEATEGWYHYTEGYPSTFFTLGETYTFNIEGSADVPALTKSIDFPSAEPHITSPGMNDTLSLSGFTVTWTGTSSEDIFIYLGDTTATDSVGVETDNDGSHTFSSSDLSALEPGPHTIGLYMRNYEYIEAAGYDSRSTIFALCFTNILVYLE